MSSRPFLRAVPFAAACIAMLAVPAAAQRPVRDPRLHELVPVPGDLNYRLPVVTARTMEQLLGRPARELVEECDKGDVENPQLKAMMIGQNIGRLKLRGLRPAVAAVERIMERVKADSPDLFAALTTEGMLCVRRVRTAEGQPKSKNFSNHAWGAAIDFRINAQLDSVEDRRTQRGLLMLYPYFRRERFFWGAAFKGKREDAMHFEASDELMREWVKSWPAK